MMEGSQCPALKTFQAQREHEESHRDVIRKRKKEHPGRMSQWGLGTQQLAETGSEMQSGAQRHNTLKARLGR